MVNKEQIRHQAKLELARREFFYFCRLKAPDFYTEDRPHLIELCEDLQSFYENDDHDVLVINMPPRHGKSRTAGLLTQWVFGKNQQEKVMTGSYNENLSTVFSKAVRNSIAEEKADPDKVVYSEVFPGVKIQKGDAAANLWGLEGGHNSYLATSPSGSATGFGCTLMIIDDLIKLNKEAYNANVLREHWSWFVNTMLSRLESGGKIIIIMTRWATGDLAGRVLGEYEDGNEGSLEGYRVKHICMKAEQDDGSMLCDEILSKEEYAKKTRAMDADIVAANYNQDPIDIKGRLYQRFKTYTELPTDDEGNSLFTHIGNYTDTADQGDDFLCSIDYGEYNQEVYILNVLYTKDSMEITEPQTAQMLFDDGVNTAFIESNNGGRGFARAVEKVLLTVFKSNKTIIRWFHQSQNKKARIISNATWVMEHIYFPVNWRDRWPAYYLAMTKYQKEGKNEHDDAPDATTGIAEKVGMGNVFSFD